MRVTSVSVFVPATLRMRNSWITDSTLSGSGSVSSIAARRVHPVFEVVSCGFGLGPGSRQSQIPEKPF